MDLSGESSDDTAQPMREPSEQDVLAAAAIADQMLSESAAVAAASVALVELNQGLNDLIGGFPDRTPEIQECRDFASAVVEALKVKDLRGSEGSDFTVIWEVYKDKKILRDFLFRTNKVLIEVQAFVEEHATKLLEELRGLFVWDLEPVAPPSDEQKIENEFWIPRLPPSLRQLAKLALTGAFGTLLLQKLEATGKCPVNDGVCRLIPVLVTLVSDRYANGTFVSDPFLLEYTYEQSLRLYKQREEGEDFDVEEFVNEVFRSVVVRIELERMLQRASVDPTGTAFSSPRGFDWGYDALGQAVKSDSPVSGFDRAYEYDGIGNRKKSANSLTLPGSDNYTSNAVNQYTAVDVLSPTYDDDGNATGYPLRDYPSALNTLAWDGENRLVSVTYASSPPATHENLYDAQSRRFSRMDGTPGQFYVITIYDGWNPIAEYRINNNDPIYLSRVYTWGLDLSGTLQGADGVGGLLAMMDHDEDLQTYTTFDGNGNVSEYIEAGGSVVGHFEYDAFGGLTEATASPNWYNIRFSTKGQDQSGLYYYGYRYYDPLTGRFISRDPIEEKGGLNIYGFVSNRPVDHLDRLGLAAWSVYKATLLERYFGEDNGNSHGSLFTDQEVAQLKVVIKGECDPNTGILSGKWTESNFIKDIDPTYENISQYTGDHQYPGTDKRYVHDYDISVSFDTSITSSVIDNAYKGGVTGGIVGCYFGPKGAIVGTTTGVIGGGLGGLLWQSELTASIHKRITVECKCQTEGEFKGKYMRTDSIETVQKKNTTGFYWQY
jgi:RHS repeat-associated protein